MTIGNGPNGPDSGFLAQSRWTDASFPATASKLGLLNKPDYDYTNRGLLFPQNDTSEFIQVIHQMDHAKKQGTQIRLHVHFIQTSALLPIFKVDYKWWNNGDEVPAADTTISTADGAGPLFPFTANPIMQLIPFPYIDAPANEAISSHLEFNLYRDDNIITGDVLFKYVDFHYEKDGDGSREEFSK
jgi:hypothetical protein